MLRKLNDELNDRIFNKTGKKTDNRFLIIFYLRNHRQSGTELNIDMNLLPATFIKLILLVVVALIHVAKHN